MIVEPSLQIEINWSRVRDSNSRQIDYKSITLPTELTRHPICENLIELKLLSFDCDFVLTYDQQMM